MIFEKIIEELSGNYLVDIGINSGDNQFVDKQLKISDPNGIGLGLELGINSRGEVSVFDTEIFSFPYFNIAEGYTQEDFRLAVAHVMEGSSLVVKRILFGGYTLEFETQINAVGKLSLLRCLLNPELKTKALRMKKGYKKLS